MTEIGLKGQHISARGKAIRPASDGPESVAPGFGIEIEIDREPTCIEKQQLLRSKWLKFS